MEELKLLQEKLAQERPMAWEELPDIALYMDQVISYMPRQMLRFDEDDQITSAMVNNYIKDGVVPRADGKRYGRAHIGFLTAVCMMKRVLSVREIGTLFRAVPEGSDPQQLYGYFTSELDTALNKTAQSMETAEDISPARLALALALRSYADQLACRQILATLCQDDEPQEQKKEKKEKKKKEKNSQQL